MATTSAVARTEERTWRPPERSPVQERFYRDLMQTRHLPSAPEIAQRVEAALRREDVNMRDLAALISRDQALTASLLRLANSALFAFRAEVTSVLQAVNLLGIGRVRDVVLGLSVWGNLDPKDAEGRRRRKELWVHTTNVAAAARMLARVSGGDADAAFAAGLMHDVGKLVLGIRLGDSYWSMLDMAREEGRPTVEIEREAFSCDHGTVGGWLLQLWKLPESLTDAVALHHEPLSREHGLDAPGLIAIADRMVNASDPTTGTVPTEILADLEAVAPGTVSPERWGVFFEDLARERAAVEDIFGG